MDDEKRKVLLENTDVVKEIHRHLWFESEKAGRELGFEWAAEDWLKRFSKAWVDYHIPKKVIKILTFPQKIHGIS